MIIIRSLHMDNIINIITEFALAILTGFITFLITKYTQNKNVPLDKMEIAYNRIYYPLYCLIKNENIDNDIDNITNKIKFYLDKYDKYVDKSTIKAFTYLLNSNTQAKKQEAYYTFKENIYNMNSYLRTKLGYLESNFLHIYPYISKSEKSTFRIYIEFCLCYLCAILYDKFFTNKIVVYIFSLLFFILIIEIIHKFYKFLYFKLKK